MPAISFKTFGSVIGKPALNMAINRDTVVIIKRSQLAEFHGAGQRAGFVGNSFHHATIAHKSVGVMVDHVMPWAVKLCTQRTFSNSKTDGVGDALTERTGGGFNTR